MLLSICEPGRFICVRRNIFVPFNVWPIQTITHSKGDASIRQTERPLRATSTRFTPIVGIPFHVIINHSVLSTNSSQLSLLAIRWSGDSFFSILWQLWDKIFAVILFIYAHRVPCFLIQRQFSMEFIHVVSDSSGGI